MKHLRNKIACAVAGLILATSAHAQNGVTDVSVTFAQVAALEGPAADLGLDMQAGILAAFEEVNREGGIFGRKLILEAFDDGYEPDKSVAQVTRVIESGKYIGIIGPVGTPTTQATQPLATAANMPFIGPFTGAGFLRNPELRNVFNYRASYGAETEAWMQYLVDSLGMKNIALLYQDDGFGYVGRDGVNAALEKRGMATVASGTYTRNTTDIDAAYDAIRAADPEAVVMVGAYAPIAAFIKKARADGFNPTFVTISFVGARPLSKELASEGEGVIVSQVVPFPLNGSIRAVQQYQMAMIAAGQTERFGFGSLEGYLVGRLAIEALKNTGPVLTQERFLRTFGALREVDIGGLLLEFGPEDNQGSDMVFLSRIMADGSYADVNPATSAPGQ